MKPGLAILPLEVWADVSEHPLLSRQLLAQIADNNGDPDFTNKLQKLLHGCGKQTLRYLDIRSKKDMRHHDISSKLPDKSNVEPERQASLTVTSDGWKSYAHWLLTTKECEFPTTEMPENIKMFTHLSISYLDDQVLDFLEKIKPLLNDVDLHITEYTRDFFAHFLPMLGAIRSIHCGYREIEFLERHFPGFLAPTKEFHLYFNRLAPIPGLLRWMPRNFDLLDWLSAPQNFDVDGPRFLSAESNEEDIFAFVDAVRKHFLAATTQSAFVVFLQLDDHVERQLRADEFTIENATTKEQLTVRNECFKRKWLERWIETNYVEIMRHPIGANAKMRDWISRRGFYLRRNNWSDVKESKVIFLFNRMTIGRISKKGKALDQAGNETVDDDEHEAGPSA